MESFLFLLLLNKTGTFGQLEQWSLHNASSWQHPAVPFEVLVDPLSMPAHGKTHDNSKTIPLKDASCAKAKDTSEVSITLIT